LKNSKIALKKIKAFLLHAALVKAKAKIVEKDNDCGAYLIDFENDSYALVSLSENLKTIEFEGTIVFDSDLVNLKTLSSIAHAAFCSGLSTTGICVKNENQVKIYVRKSLDFFAIYSRFEDELEITKNCISSIRKYLHSRLDQIQHTYLDLSMFNDIDLLTFDPQGLGEKKDFVYENWENYMNAVLAEDNSVFNAGPKIEDLIACAEFEDKNEVLLSEIGNSLLKEIDWNRQMHLAMASSGKYFEN